MEQIKSELFTLNIDPQKGIFSILSVDPGLPNLLDARLGLAYRSQGKLFAGMESSWRIENKRQQKVTLPAHGETEMLTLDVLPDANGIVCHLTFGLMQKMPLVMWKIEVANESKDPINVNSIDLMHLDPRMGGEVKWPKAKKQQELGFFSNGWQSWSPSRGYTADERMNTSRLGFLQLPMTKNAGTPLPKTKGQFSSDFFAVIGDRVARTGFVLGSLSQMNHFTSIYVDFNQGTTLRMWANGDDTRLDPGCSMTTDWAVISLVKLDQPDPLENYLQAVARENHIRIPEESPVGWCSWYHFYTHISEQIIQNNLQAVVDKKDTLPIQLVQIDDGFESQIGDWFSFKPEFPQGLKPLADDIKKQGLLPGLWLAPFILHPKAEIIKQHPEWLLCKANGKPAKAGYVWGTITEALDLTVPEALDYACRVVKTASAEWGYPYLKLDFLYAAAVECQYRDQTLTRAQVLRLGMEAIRKAVGPAMTLLGCGAPLGSILGLVEANRIGADVSGDWNPNFNGFGLFIKDEPAFPCARNSIRNILTRANLHQQWWINDPDCLLVRPESHLSLAEVQTLASVISLTGGSLLVSDDLPKLPEERLRIAECLLPVMGTRAQVIDLFDTDMPARLRLDQVNETGEWHILAKFNWQDKPAALTISANEYQLPAGDYWVSEFWSGSSSLVKDVIKFESVPAHGCVVMSWRKIQPDKPIFVGSDLHISQGLEVAEWKIRENEIRIKLDLSRKTSGTVKVWVPGQVRSVRVNEEEEGVLLDSAGLLEIPVEVNGIATVLIKK